MNTTYITLAAADVAEAERLSLFDELGLNVGMDSRGRVVGLEILDGSHIASLLAARAPG